MANFEPIIVPNVPDLIIAQILEKLKKGEIHPGMQLPAEQSLQQFLRVPKQQVKAAFKKMEVYRIVHTKPQSGTYLADINRKILIGLMENILNIGQSYPPLALLDVRATLEVKAVGLAAQQCSEEELEQLTEANEIYHRAAKADNLGMEDDFFFHQEIVRFSHNPVLISLYSFVTLEMIGFWKNFLFRSGKEALQRLSETYREHQQILASIGQRDSAAAQCHMQLHLDNVHSLLEAGNKAPPNLQAKAASK